MQEQLSPSPHSVLTAGLPLQIQIGRLEALENGPISHAADQHSFVLLGQACPYIIT